MCPSTPETPTEKTPMVTHTGPSRRPGGYTTAGSGKSMSRALGALFAASICFSLVWVAVRQNAISAPWATVATGVGATIFGVWGLGKVRRKPPEEPKP